MLAPTPMKKQNLLEASFICSLVVGMSHQGVATCVSNVTQCFASLRAQSLDLEEDMFSGAILCSQPELFKLLWFIAVLSGILLMKGCHFEFGTIVSYNREDFGDSVPALIWRQELFMDASKAHLCLAFLTRFTSDPPCPFELDPSFACHIEHSALTRLSLSCSDTETLSIAAHGTNVTR